MNILTMSIFAHVRLQARPLLNPLTLLLILMVILMALPFAPIPIHTYAHAGLVIPQQRLYNYTGPGIWARLKGKITGRVPLHYAVKAHIRVNSPTTLNAKCQAAEVSESGRLTLQDHEYAVIPTHFTAFPGGNTTVTIYFPCTLPSSHLAVFSVTPTPPPLPDGSPPGGGLQVVRATGYVLGVNMGNYEPAVTFLLAPEGKVIVKNTSKWVISATITFTTGNTNATDKHTRIWLTPGATRRLQIPSGAASAILDVTGNPRRMGLRLGY